MAGVNSNNESIPAGLMSVFSNYFTIVPSPGLFLNYVIIPIEFELYQNYPKPFNPNTQIKIGISKNTYGKLSLYDNSSQEILNIFNKVLSIGQCVYNLNGSTLFSSIYFFKFESERGVNIKKMIIIK